MGQYGMMIVNPGRMALGLAERMIKDVPSGLFARKPVIDAASGRKVIDTNHPAFVYGHLSTYPGKLIQMLGADASVVRNPAGFEDLFAAGKECRDDPEGAIYPPMEKIAAHFFAGHRAMLAAIEAADDSVHAGPNPREGRMKELLPTLGALAIFYTSSHVMNHLGQVSAWRRCVGLGPVSLG